MNPEHATLDLMLALGGMGAAVLGTVLAVLAVRRMRRAGGRTPRNVWLLAAALLIAVGGTAAGMTPYLADKGWGGMIESGARIVAPLLGWMAVANGVAIGGWALLADRSRGRRRCPRCWYDMAGVPGLQCPECGHEARRERSLFRTRRHWKRAAIGPGLLALGYAGIMLPRMMVMGWPSVMPTPVLIAVLELEGWPRPAGYRPRDAAAELMARTQLGIAGWERGFVYRRMARYWTFDYRKQWVAGVPVAVKPTGIDWYASRGGATKLRVRMLRAEGDPGPWQRCELRHDVSFNQLPAWNDGYVEMGVLPVGTTQMRLEVQVTRDTGTAVWEGQPEPLWSTEVSWPMSLRGSIGEVLTPMKSASLDQDVQGAFVAEPYGMVLFAAAWRSGAFSYRFEAAGTGWTGVARALKVEYVHDGEVAAVSRYWGSDSARRSVGEVLPLSVLRGPDPTCVDVTADPAWTIRVSGDPELALRDFAATSYWAGSVTFRPTPPSPPPGVQPIGGSEQ